MPLKADRRIIKEAQTTAIPTHEILVRIATILLSFFEKKYRFAMYNEILMGYFFLSNSSIFIA